jgi:clan AA aspartic protease
MKGSVDENGRALVVVRIRPSASAQAEEIQAWIDTGFTGELVLPQQQIDRRDLPPLGVVGAILADGSKVSLKTYGCLINWFEEDRYLEVVANDGEFPLLGVGLLMGHVLRVDYRTREITID